MVFGDGFPQKDRLPFPLVEIVVHREVQNLAAGIIVPILGTICGENGMFHGKDKGAALCETGVYLLYDSFKGCNVVKRQGAQDDFKAFRRDWTSSMECADR